jgi:hypothetical protein
VSSRSTPQAPVAISGARSTLHLKSPARKLSRARPGLERSSVQLGLEEIARKARAAEAARAGIEGL